MYNSHLLVLCYLLWASLIAELVKNTPVMQAGDTGSIPGSGRSIGEGTGYPLQ